MLREPRQIAKTEKTVRTLKVQTKRRFKVVKLEERVVPADLLGTGLLGKGTGGTLS